MKNFWIRIVNVAAILVIIFGYNMVTEAREKDDEIAKLSAQIQSEEAGGDTAGSYKDGSYEGTATGFGGDITVEVTIADGKITDVEILSAEKEDSAYLTMAKDIIPEIIDAQSADVDTISGATFSSTGIKNATAQALEKGGTN